MHVRITLLSASTVLIFNKIYNTRLDTHMIEVQHNGYKNVNDIVYTTQIRNS